jgi:hypothetical protein
MYCPYCGVNVTEGTDNCPNCQKSIPYSTVMKPYKYPDPEPKPVHTALEDIEVLAIDRSQEAENLNEDDSAWGLFTRSIGILFRNPILIVPLFCSWVVFASTIVYTRFYLPLPSSLGQDLLYTIMLIIFLSLIICSANLMMLEFMQQIESGQKISIKRALKETFGIDFIRMVPIAMIWSVLWFIIVILRGLTSRKKRSDKPKISPEEIAETLADPNWGPFSWFGLGLNLMEKLIRMVVFLMLPAIAWENASPLSASRKAFDTIRQHPAQFIANYSLSVAVTTVIAIPLAFILTLAARGVNFSSGVWVGIIIWEGIVWTIGVYLEQMSGAMLYLWHLKWLKNGANGKIISVQKPNLLDNVYELK